MHNFLIKHFAVRQGAFFVQKIRKNLSFYYCKSGENGIESSYKWDENPIKWHEVP